MEGTRTTVVCDQCGSGRVFRDADARWDNDSQSWVLRDLRSAAWCADCQDETSLKEVDLEEWRLGKV